MKMNEILDVITALAPSQGFYGHLLNNISRMKETDTRKYGILAKMLEGKNFKDPVDVILFFETEAFA